MSEIVPNCIIHRPFERQHRRDIGGFLRFTLTPFRGISLMRNRPTLGDIGGFLRMRQRFFGPFRAKTPSCPAALLYMNLQGFLAHKQTPNPLGPHWTRGIMPL